MFKMSLRVLNKSFLFYSKFTSDIVSKNVRIFSSATPISLKVAERIKQKRNAALLGGGQKRIDAQHKKVSINYAFPVFKILDLYFAIDLIKFYCKIK